MSNRVVRYCPMCGTLLEQRPVFGKQRGVCPACDWAHFEDPKVAVTALIIQEGRVLLTRRINEPQQGKWTLPGGFMDAGEDPPRAAERECLEETGLVIQTGDLLRVLTGREHPRGADILLAYQAKIISGVLAAGDDAGEVGFFALNDLPPLAFESTRKILLG
jgi:8-oxo-dGTP diphosphatase